LRQNVRSLGDLAHRGIAGIAKSGTRLGNSSSAIVTA
jgi:hypothetical protein